MRAVIFDMDGVIVDSEAKWRAAEGDFYRAHIPGWQDSNGEKFTGLGVRDVHRLLVREHRFSMAEAEFLEHSEAVARQVYSERVDCAPGLAALARGLKDHGVRTAIASSSPARWVKLVVDRFDLGSLLDVTVSADDVGERTKPLPDLYLVAAARLGLSPDQCLAIEDSAVGLTAAKRAGLRAAALRTSHNQTQDLALADFELNGFSDLDYSSLTARLHQAAGRG